MSIALSKLTNAKSDFKLQRAFIIEQFTTRKSSADPINDPSQDKNNYSIEGLR